MLLNFIEELPTDLVSDAVFSYLKISDIVRLERASGSKKSLQHLLNLISHCAPCELPYRWYSKNRNISALEWSAKRQLKIKYLSIPLPVTDPGLLKMNLKVDRLDLHIQYNVTMDSCKPFLESNMDYHIREILVDGHQNQEVMEQLSLNTGNVEKLQIRNASTYNDWLNKDILSRWKLKELIVYGCLQTISLLNLIMLTTYLELTNIELNASTVDDNVVLAVTQCNHKLENFKIPIRSEITYTSLITLSDHKLPLKELNLRYIPTIPTADIARRCCHALSRISFLSTCTLKGNQVISEILIPYLTRITILFFDYYYHSYMPLLTQYCTKLTRIVVFDKTNSVEYILPLCRTNPLLREMIYKCKGGFTDTILIELIHACPHLRVLNLPYETAITDIGILALSVHCSQLNVLHISNCKKVTEAAVLQLLQRCCKLTRLEVSSSSLSEETWTQLDKNTQKRVSRW